MTFLNYFRDTEVADFYSLLAVEEDVVKLDVSVDHGPTVDVSQPISDLLEDELSIRLLELALPLYQSEEISTSSILHHHEQVFAGFEHFEQSDDI